MPRGITLISYYVFSKLYKSDMSLDDLSCLVSGTIKDAVKIDGSRVGEPIKISIIDSDGVREQKDNEVAVFLEKWGKKFDLFWKE